MTLLATLPWIAHAGDISNMPGLYHQVLLCQSGSRYSKWPALPFRVSFEKMGRPILSCPIIRVGISLNKVGLEAAFPEPFILCPW